MRVLGWFAIGAVLLVIALLAWRATRRPPAIEHVADAIHALVATRAVAWPDPDPVSVRVTWNQVRSFYARRHHDPVWMRDNGPRLEAWTLARALQNAGEEGLDPADYDVDSLAAALDSARIRGLSGEEPPPRSIAALDIRLTAAWLRYAGHLRHGRVRADSIDASWTRWRDGEDLVTALRDVVKDRPRDLALPAFSPADSEYLRLRDALHHYQAIVEAGGWVALPALPKLKRGDRGHGVALLRQRLRQEGDFAEDGGEAFDDSLAAALRRFQRRHALDADGVLGAGTLAELQIPADARVRTLALNLERRRWLPRALGDPRMVVNVPDARLVLTDHDTTAFDTRVVVGLPTRPTPLLSDRIVAVEFNPVWHIPQSIVRDEIGPSVRRDKHYLEAHHMTVHARRQGWTGPPVLPDTIDWKIAGADTFLYMVQQDAGPENPLGLFKFMGTNHYDVYLHDTSARELFNRPVRALSHGCVRVERPDSLAKLLLAGTPQALPESIAAMVDSGYTRRFRVRPSLPVHLMYWTAWVEPNGAVEFRPDVYGIDRRLDAALRARQPWTFRLNLESSAAPVAP